MGGVQQMLSIFAAGTFNIEREKMKIDEKGEEWGRGRGVG